MIKKEKIDLALDLHEAAPEYPVINAMVFHERASELAVTALLELQLQGFEFRLEESPLSLRGLSHREWGDHTGARSILLESANASQGRLRGRTSSELVVEGRDKNYMRAAKKDLLFVPFKEGGIPLDQRVSRHLAAVKALLQALSELEPGQGVEVQGIPSVDKVIERGAGYFLRPPP
jgi:hypothetical protein